MSCVSCVVKPNDYDSDNLYTWCTNCGNYGIHAGVKRALVNLQIEPRNTLLCFDIGCNGNGSDKIGGYRFHGLHGRIIPFATGAKLANSKLHVIAFAGDGATLGEGINHLIHAIRHDYNITFILHNNSNYGLTKGQASPSTKQNVRMESTPEGVTAIPINPTNLALNIGASFAARSFSGNVKQIQQVVEKGINHNGFSFIEILQACPTYNKATPHEWYMQRIIDIDLDPNYEKDNLNLALKKSLDLENEISTGVLYVKERLQIESSKSPINLKSLLHNISNHLK